MSGMWKRIFGLWKRLRNKDSEKCKNEFYDKSVSEIIEILRPYYLSHENISQVAKTNWEDSGRIEGRDDFNWSVAKMKLEILLETDAEIYWAHAQAQQWKDAVIAESNRLNRFTNSGFVV